MDFIFNPTKFSRTLKTKIGCRKIFNIQISVRTAHFEYIVKALCAHTLFERKFIFCGLFTLVAACTCENMRNTATEQITTLSLILCVFPVFLQSFSFLISFLFFSSRCFCVKHVCSLFCCAFYQTCHAITALHPISIGSYTYTFPESDQRIAYTPKTLLFMNPILTKECNEHTNRNTHHNIRHR